MARHRRLGLALFVIATAQLMVVLDAAIVNVALPHIQRALGFTGNGLEWVVTAYAVTFGGLLLLGGRLGDLLGRRRIFICGAAAVLRRPRCSAGSPPRRPGCWPPGRIQGVGGAMIAPTALALITTTFPQGPQRNRAMGVYAAMSGGGAAVGLVAGGLLTTYLSWRWVLFVNVPIGILVGAARPYVSPSPSASAAGSTCPGAITGTAGVARCWCTACPTRAPTPSGVSHWGDAKVFVSLIAAVGAAGELRVHRVAQPARAAAAADAGQPQPDRRRTWSCCAWPRRCSGSSSS